MNYKKIENDHNILLPKDLLLIYIYICYIYLFIIYIKFSKICEFTLIIPVWKFHWIMYEPLTVQI